MFSVDNIPPATRRPLATRTKNPEAIELAARFRTLQRELQAIGTGRARELANECGGADGLLRRGEVHRFPIAVARQQLAELERKVARLRG